MAQEYVFREFSPSFLPGLKAFSPIEVGQALEDIRQQFGRLEPPDVVAALRFPDHPLHNVINWDQQAAAERDFLRQARRLISSIEIYDSEEKRLFPAFINVRGAEDYQRAYYRIQDVTSDSRLRIAALRQAEKDLESWARRYQELKDVIDLLAPARTALRRHIEDEDRPSA